MMTHTNAAPTFSAADDIQDFAVQVAKILGWHAVPRHPDDNQALAVISQSPLDKRHSPFGRMVPKIYLQAGSWSKGRLMVQANWPQDAQGQQEAPSSWSSKGERHEITCSLDKSPAQVATDISRKLLPRWLSVYADMVKRITEREAGARACEATAERLAVAIKSEVHVPEEGRAQFSNLMHDDVGIGLSVEVKGYAGDDVQIKIELSHLDETQAMEVLALYRKMIGEGS